jgi:flagellar biosynthetic protein FliQ
MDLAQVSGLLQQTLWLTLELAAPLLAAALVVGLAISILQAATQVNEQTLTFVPKIVVTLLVFAWIFPQWMGLLVDFTRRLMTTASSLP